MIKTIIIGLWVCAVTLGSVYFSVQMGTADKKTEDVPEMLGGLETVRGEITTIPVIADGGVQGYFLTRLSYTADPAKIAKLSVPANEMITDALYTQLVGNKDINFAHLEQFDLKGFKEGIKTALNTRLGEDIFHDVIVEQIDYLAKQDIRANARKGGQSVTGLEQQVGNGGDGPPPAAEAAPAH